MDVNEEFLFVHETTLGMHWLYTFHSEVDSDDTRNITGHWRAPESGWFDELENGTKYVNRGNLSQVNWLVTAPGIEGPTDGWTLFQSGNADFFNGGGTWKIWYRN